MNILVAGGAGYIGSHMVKMLSKSGNCVTTFDNLSTGHRWAVKWGDFVEGDLLDLDALAKLFSKNSFDAVMHFSARSLVGESFNDPALYYRNNLIGTINLLEAMQAAGWDTLNPDERLSPHEYFYPFQEKRREVRVLSLAPEVINSNSKQ